MLEFIQRAIHMILTASGDSGIIYGGEAIGDWKNKQQGVIQGNTADPGIWSALSSVIFDVLHIQSFAVNMVAAISKQLITLVDFIYADDCDLIQSDNNNIEVLASMQSLIKSWDSIMQVTGEGGTKSI